MCLRCASENKHITQKEMFTSVLCRHLVGKLVLINDFLVFDIRVVFTVSVSSRFVSSRASILRGDINYEETSLCAIGGLICRSQKNHEIVQHDFSSVCWIRAELFVINFSRASSLDGRFVRRKTCSSKQIISNFDLCR